MLVMVPNTGVQWAANEHHYGGEHRRLSVVDRLGERVERRLRVSYDAWDPRFVDRIQPVLDAAMTYFDAEVCGFEHLPTQGPALIVANHSGGMFMPDFWALLRHWLRERGPCEPLYSLGFDFLFSIPGLGSLARRIGSVPASHENGARLLADGAFVVVYPGGDAEDYRPWTQRHRIDLHGRTGFVRLALRAGVPVVPVVSHGSHDALIVVARGEAMARRLRLDRLRINVLPFVAVPPFGVMPIVPPVAAPAKLTVRVCEPIDWTSHGPDAAENAGTVRHCYEEILGRMQANLDDLVQGEPHPILARVRDPFRRGSRARGTQA
jgi:1-acyl-sn-glycerol-3-phosphate acyltransferase